MESESELRTWLWIFRLWIPLYALLMIVRVILGITIAPTFFWYSLLLVVPVVVVPVTYKELVGGGCSIRYHICPLVKGILAGLIMYFMAIAVEFFINVLMSDNLIWATLYSSSIIRDPHQIWWFSGLAGGILARIAEVRGVKRSAKITIS